MTDHGDFQRGRGLPLLVTLLALGAYVIIQSAAFGGGWFIADDAQELAFVNEVENPWTLFGADSFALFRPVKNFIFLAFTALAPHGVAGCRVLALLIGIASFFPVRALCRHVLGDDFRSSVAAAIWLLSPTLVSSVAWLSCLNIQVMTAFAALAVVAHDTAFESPRRWAWGALSLGASAVAMLSYESAVCLPGVLVAFDLVLRPGRSRTRGAVVSYVLAFLVVAAYLALRAEVNGVTEVSGSFASTTRFEMALAAPYFTMAHFLSWAWPFGRFLAFGSFRWNPSLVPALVGAFLACAALGVAALVFARRAKAFAFGILLAFIAFGPTSNLLGFGNGPYGDYYLSFASVGLALALTAIAFGAIDRVREEGGKVLLAVPLLLFGLRLAAIPEAYHWAANWGAGIGAFVESIANFPSVYSNKIVVSQWLCDRGQYEAALALGREVEEAVGADSDQLSIIHLVRGLYALNVTRDADEALGCFRRSRFLRGGKTTNRHFYVGCVLEDLKGDVAGAEREYRAAIPSRWNADTVPAANRLARLLALRGDLSGAIALLEKAHRVNPEDRDILANLETARRERAGRKAGDGR